VKSGKVWVPARWTLNGASSRYGDAGRLDDLVEYVEPIEYTKEMWLSDKPKNRKAYDGMNTAAFIFGTNMPGWNTHKTSSSRFRVEVTVKYTGAE
jgi:hypothetical protein